jgi:hypothetical protein
MSEMEKNKGGRPIKRILTCEDIKDLIKCGKEYNVAQLSFGKLSVVYLGGHPTTFAIAPQTQEQLDKMQREDLEDAELEIRDRELALKAIEDPEEYERLLASGELTRK